MRFPHIINAGDKEISDCVEPVQEMPGAFFGKSSGIQRLSSILSEVAWSEAPVLIQGETGTGKEVVARRLHQLSPRAAGPFLKINCAALPSELIESELFGYERGAFTGALQRKPGLFELANRGTILLDEIGDMDVRHQAKLLQVLQDQEFQRVGGRDVIRVDVRVISATHRDLYEAVAGGSFRQDLFYRLEVVSLEIPPLRDRPEEIVPLAKFLLARHAVADMPVPFISSELEAVLLEYHWPGNVRELENMMRKLLVFGDPNIIVSELKAKCCRVKPHLLATESRGIPKGAAGGRDFATLTDITSAKEQAEAEVILSTLTAVRWNRKRAAAMLGMKYKALLYKMKNLQLVDLDAPGIKLRSRNTCWTWRESPV